MVSRVNQLESIRVHESISGTKRKVYLANELLVDLAQTGTVGGQSCLLELGFEGFEDLPDFA